MLVLNVISPGDDWETKITPAEVASYTIKTLSKTIPSVVPGILFMGGGKSEEDISIHLNEVNKLEWVSIPWTLSFSLRKTLQVSCLKSWWGKDENIEAGQKAFLERIIANWQALLGKYEGGCGDTEW